MSNPGEILPAKAVTFGQFTLVPAERLLKFEGSPLFLGSRAMDILTTLVEQAGTVVSKKELIARTWPDLNVDESGLRVQIAALRKLLKDGQSGNRYIASVSGRGYCFVAPIERGGQAQVEDAVAKSDTSALPYGLPPRLMRMVGRDETVQDLSTRLLEHRFISVTGAGGMGKTTIAVSVAHKLARAFGNAVWFIDLSETNSPDLILGKLAMAFGIAGPTADLLPSLSAFVRDKRLLLVLDNCEHVIAAVASIAEALFKSAPGLHILATSREVLRVNGEGVYRLQPLESPPPELPLSAAEVLGYPAAQLFMERATASGANIFLGNAEARLVSSICSRLDGIALAIDIAARRVGAHGLAGTAELLNHRSWLHWHGPRTAHPRHQTLQAVFDWSHDLLVEIERLIIRRLSIFESIFTLEAACAVATDTEICDEMVVEIMYGLVAKSLVSAVVDASGAVTYRLFGTIRAHASEKLVQSNESDSVARKHADYVSRVVRERANVGEARHTAARQRSYLANVRAALGTCFADQVTGVSSRNSKPLSLSYSSIG